MKITLTPFLFLFPVTLFSQQNYQLAVRDSATLAPTVKQSLVLSNGNELINGQTISTAYHDYLLMLDGNDSMLWNKSFSAVGLVAMKETNDGGIVAVGSTTSYGPSSTENIIVIRFDASGNQVWCHAYGDSNGNNPLDVMVFPDSTIRILGSDATITTAPGVVMTDLDPQGHIISNKRIDFVPYGSSGPLGKLFPDGSALIFAPGGNGQIRTTLLNSSENIVWSKDYMLNDSHIPYVASCEKTGIGGFIVGGDLNQSKAFVLAIDSLGNALWARKMTDGINCGFLGGTYDSIHQLYLATGTCTQTDYGTNMLYQAYDLSGGLVASRVYGDYFDDAGCDVKMRRDSTIEIVGTLKTSSSEGEIALVRGDYTGATGYYCYHDYSFPTTDSILFSSVISTSASPYPIVYADSVIDTLPLTSRTFYQRQTCPRPSYDLASLVSSPYDIAYDPVKNNTLEAGGNQNGNVALGEIDNDGHILWDYTYDFQNNTSYNNSDFFYRLGRNGVNWELCGGSKGNGSGPALWGYTDSAGMPLSFHLYSTLTGGFSMTNLFSGFISYPDSTAILCGISQVGQVDYVTLAKVDKNGHLLWSLYAGDSCSEMPRIFRTSQGVVVSMTLIEKDVLSAFDTTGQLLWSGEYHTSPYEIYHTTTTQYPNGDFLLAGFIDTSTVLQVKPKLAAMRISSSGAPLWAKVYSTTSTTAARSACIYRNDTAVIGGEYYSPPYTYYQGLCYAIDGNGSIVKSFEVMDTQIPYDYKQRAIISDGECGLLQDAAGIHTRFYPFAPELPCNVQPLPVQVTPLQFSMLSNTEPAVPCTLVESEDTLLPLPGISQEIICYNVNPIPACPNDTNTNTTGLPSTGTPANGVLIYPNPVESEMNIVFNHHYGAKTTIVISDVLGRVVSIADDPDLSQQGAAYKYTFDAHMLQNGVYVVSIITGEKMYTDRFVVTHDK